MAGRNLLELGLGTSCTAAVGPRALPTLASNASQVQDLLSALGQLWVEGHDVDADLLMLHRAWRRTPMPGYPFQRMVHLLPQVEQTTAKRSKILSPDEWFHAPQWRTLALPKPLSTQAHGPRMLFLPESETGPAGPQDIRVHCGEHLRRCRTAGSGSARGMPATFRSLPTPCKRAVSPAQHASSAG